MKFIKPLKVNVVVSLLKTLKGKKISEIFSTIIWLIITFSQYLFYLMSHSLGFKLLQIK